MLTNAASGKHGHAINHDEVLNMTAQMNADVGMLLLRFFETYAQ